MAEERRAQCAIHEAKLANLEATSQKILKLLEGNGNMGINTKASLAYNDLIERKKNKWDLYRGLILIIMSVVLTLVGSIATKVYFG